MDVDEFHEATRTSPLMIASGMGHLAIVRMCIEEFELCPNKQDFVRTPLTTAAAQGDLEVARYLVAHGATPRSRRMRTALGKVAAICNAGEGALDGVRFFVEELGCEVNKQDGLRRTALWWAIHRRQLGVVEYLVKAGADPALTDYEGRNMFDCACQDDEESYTLLLEECVYPFIQKMLCE